MTIASKLPSDARHNLVNYTKRFVNARQRRKEYIVSTKRAVEIFCQYMGRRVRIGEIRTDLIHGFVEFMRQEGCSGATIVKHRGRIVAIWSFAYERGDNHFPPPIQLRPGEKVYVPKEPDSDSDEFGPLPECHESDGRAIVTINGLVHDLGEAGSDESQVRYQQVVSEYEASGRPAYFGLPTDNLTVLQMIRYYESFARRYYGSGSRNQGEVTLDAVRYLAMYHNMLAREFGPLQLQAARMRMARAGCCRNYCNDATKRIKRVFRWAVAQRLIPAEVAHGLGAVSGWRKGHCPARESKPVTAVDAKRVDDTLPHLHPVIAAMVLFQRHTGCRPAEVCLLRPMDIDRSGDVWVYTPLHHKTEHHDKSRQIFIGPQAQDVLRPYLLRAGDAFCFSPQDVRADRLEKRRRARKTPLRYGNSPGTNRKADPQRRPQAHYIAGSYRYAIVRTCNRIGVPPWSPNQLRHLAATEIRKRYGLEGAQVILGHSQANVTQIYAERDSGLAMKIAKEVG
jgi:integrase